LALVWQFHLVKFRLFTNFQEIILSFSAKNETLAGKKVLLLEGAPSFKEPPKDKYSNRVSAINKQSVGLLKKLDAWNHIEAIRCKQIMQMQVSVVKVSMNSSI
jgi:hypothetical protein